MALTSISMFIVLVCLVSFIIHQSESFSIKKTLSSLFKPSLKQSISKLNSLSKLNVAKNNMKVDHNAASLEFEASTKGNAMSWTKQWYPLMVDAYLDRSKPHAHQLLGNDIVVWHDGKNWNAFEDQCPHRGVPLSEGRVEKNELMCAYHAWTYNGSGQCTSIPQAIDKSKENALLSKTCVKSHPVKVEQGLIWIWGESGLSGSDVAIEAALKQPRVVEELTDVQYNGRIAPYYYGFRDLAYGWDMFMENVMDPAHVPISHHGIVGSRYKDAKPLLLSRIKSISEIPISEGGQYNPNYPEDVGFAYEVRKATGPGNPAENDFRPPVLQKITSYLPDGAKSILALYAVPTRPGYCRHIGTQILIKGEDKKTPAGLGFFAFPLPLWLLHPLASMFLHQDMVFLHHQERILNQQSQYSFGDFQQIYNVTASPKAYSKKYFMPNPHDKMVSSLRQWIYNKAGSGPKWGTAALSRGLPQRLPEDELFDVYHSHSKHCVICMNSIKNLKILKYTAGALAILAATLMKGWKAAATTAIFALCATFSHLFSKLYFKYTFHHQDNN